MGNCLCCCPNSRNKFYPMFRYHKSRSMSDSDLALFENDFLGNEAMQAAYMPSGSQDISLANSKKWKILSKLSSSSQIIKNPLVFNLEKIKEYKPNYKVKQSNMSSNFETKFSQYLLEEDSKKNNLNYSVFKNIFKHPEDLLTRPRTHNHYSVKEMNDCECPWLVDEHLQKGILVVGGIQGLDTCPKLIVYDCLSKTQAFIDNIIENNIPPKYYPILIQRFYEAMEEKFKNYTSFIDLRMMNSECFPDWKCWCLMEWIRTIIRALNLENNINPNAGDLIYMIMHSLIKAKLTWLQEVFNFVAQYGHPFRKSLTENVFYWNALRCSIESVSSLSGYVGQINPNMLKILFNDAFVFTCKEGSSDYISESTIEYFKDVLDIRLHKPQRWKSLIASGQRRISYESCLLNDFSELTSVPE